MKKLLTIFSLLLTFICSNAQVPQALNYQAVARTADGVLIPAQSIGVRFTVLDGGVNGTVVYTETQQTTTNSYGLFTLAIGKGTAVTGTFAGINWASGTDKFLKVEIAPSGGGNYQLQGTSQLLSVPYALYSEKTRLIAGNNTINITNGNTITGNYQAANNTILLSGNTIAGNYQPANNTILMAGNTIAGNYQAGNNTVLVNGNNITGNYQAANNTVLVNGNTIAGNYQAGNNTILLNGNSITGNYQAANNTILMAGNTISGNYQAGAGINISGNTISATGANTLWVPDANGIHNQSGNVGIGINSHTNYPLYVHQNNTGVGHASAVFESDDTWQSAIGIKSNSQNFQYAIELGGSLNTAIKPSTFAIVSSNFTTNTSRLVFTIEGSNGNVGIGHTSLTNPVAKSTLHVFSGDINIEQIGSGIILKSPNGQCWRVTIDNSGNLVRTSITCL